MVQFTAPPPLALYIHIPWCLRKCPYCDFNSHELREALPENAYIDALLADLEQELPLIWGRRVQSIFFGGGTPSLLSPEAIDRLLSGLRGLLGLSGREEITLEANPGTAEAERFTAFRAAGINRLSIGVQSFNTTFLERLGRIHDGRQAYRAVELAHAAGFDEINLDLMFALPGQTVEQAAADLHDGVALEPTHFSYYQLTIEPNTAFAHAPPVLPDDEVQWRMQEQGVTLLGQSGFERYEVSAYARPGHRCRHNLNYWEFGDYLGLGAGAHGKLTRVDADGAWIERRQKQRHPRLYLEGVASGRHVSGRERVGDDELPFEFMLNALRLRDGFPSGLLSERVGLPLGVVERPLAEAQRLGLLEVTPERIAPTPRGYAYLNNLQELFLPTDEGGQTTNAGGER